MIITNIQIDQKRLINRLNTLGEFGKDPKGGWTRFSFMPEYMAARNQVKEWMEEAGMIVRADAAGNLIGRLEGEKPNLPVVATGSHIDTVRNGGLFDGNFGVVGAIEVIQTLHDNGVIPNNPIEVIVFVEEEGARFGSSLFGSRALVGEIDTEFLYQTKDGNGISIAEALKSVGLDPDKIHEAKAPKGYYKAFYEMHIEQGEVLEGKNFSVGIIDAIAGPQWLEVLIQGSPDHAGATPMNERSDALIGAAEVVIMVETVAKKTGGPLVATVGRIQVKPDGINIIPGYAYLTIDIRDIDPERRDSATSKIISKARGLCSKRNLTIEFNELVKIDPVELTPKLREVSEVSLGELNLPIFHMNSGAGHDSQTMSKITNVGMLFAPSRGGISHSPYEWTDSKDLASCTQVLLHNIIKLIL